MVNETTKSGPSNIKKLSITSLILVLVANDFGFSNVVTGYNQMGYAGIIWYVVTAIVFLFPLAMIFAEFSSSLRKDHGGFYSWLINSLGEKWAFIGTIMWVGLGLVTLLSIISSLGIDISGVIYGKDISQTWHWGPINSNEIEAIIGSLMLILLTYFSAHGFRKVAMTAAIGGVFSLTVITIFMVTSIYIFIHNHGVPSQPIHGLSSFIKSPNKQFHSSLSVGSFVIYAMFAYAGLEMASGFIDKLKNPRKDYSKAMIIVSFIMAILYSIGLFICGLATNWKQVLGSPNVDLNNNGFALFNHVGVTTAKYLGMSAVGSKIVGEFMIRFLALGSLIPLSGVIIVGIYSPIKGLIAGSSPDLWPKRVAKFNKYGMPSLAMWIECFLLVLMLILTSITGKGGQQFYQIIVDMSNVGSVIPYFFVAVGFIYFKKQSNVDRPIVFFHSMKSTYLGVGVLMVSMSIAVLFNLIVPLIQNQPMTAFWSFIGPVFLFVLGLIMYRYALHNRKEVMLAEEMQE